MQSAPHLRPYQLDLVSRVGEQVAAGRRRILLVLPTGGGKTVVAAQLIQESVHSGQRVLFLAHRRELIHQTSQKLHSVGIDHGVILAGHPTRPGERVQVAAIATLHARAVRGSAMELPPADLVLIDEAHHVRARTYQQILNGYPQAVTLGLTATPCRGDGRGLGNAFETLVEGPSVAELIAGGFLVPARVYAPSEPDLTGIRVERGDYIEAQLAERVNTVELVGDIVEHWLRLGEGRRTVVFACGIQHSVHLRNRFREAGVLAEHIDGGTPADERDFILARLADGSVDVLCNAMVLTEGWDSPSVSCLVLARPTKSLGLYRQMVGRVLRPAPGKADCLVLDHSGAVFQHGFVDDEIVWTLREDKRAENKTHAGRSTKQSARALTTCPECSAVRFEGENCSACGWRVRPKAAAVEVLPGDLHHLTRDGGGASTFDASARRRFHAELAWIARERDYKPGWISNKYRERFGVWPPDRSIEPLQPSPATRAWVKSRLIAWVHSKNRQQGAA